MSNTDPKKEIVITTDKTLETIQKTINKMVDFIKPTYGPANNKVIISKSLSRGVLDDGVQIARDYESNDQTENAIINVIREVAVKTDSRVGDGTTSSLIMLQAIINEFCKKNEKDGRKAELELKKGLEEAKEQLLKSAKKIKSKEDLKKVAMISFDNEEIAESIADLYYKLGEDGIITVDNSPTMKNIIEMTDGIKINKGYISPYMINTPERMESIVVKPHILVTDYRLTEAGDILPIMEKMAKAKITELVIIADNVEQSALATAVVNRLQGKFNITAINAPSEGDKKVNLEDIALLTGAKMFTESKGDLVQDAEISDLGKAGKFICRKEESIIVDPKGNKKDVDEAIKALKSAIEEEKDETTKKELKIRLGKFTNSIAVIKVGAFTDQERKTLKFKVEDAVNATKSALKHGVVCGGGLQLSRLKTSSPILNEALKYPSRQLRVNVGMSEFVNDLKENEAINVVTGIKGNFINVGVIDPVDVLIAGVESAVSIASVLITSTGILVEQDKKEN